MASFRWLARRFDGPGAEPLGKDFGAFRTQVSETVGKGGVGEGGIRRLEIVDVSPA